MTAPLPEEASTKKLPKGRSALAILLPVLISSGAGVASYLAGWTQPAEVIGAVTAAGTVAAATVALWVAESGNRRLEVRAMSEMAEKAVERARLAAVLGVRTEVDSQDALPGSIYCRIQNLGDTAVLNVSVDAIWCALPPVSPESYAIVVDVTGMEAGLALDILPPGHELTTWLLPNRRLTVQFAGQPPATTPISPLGKILTVVSWQERSGAWWRRIEGDLPMPLVADMPPTPPDGGVVLWERGGSGGNQVIIKSIPSGDDSAAVPGNCPPDIKDGIQPLPGMQSQRGQSSR